MDILRNVKRSKTYDDNDEIHGCIGEVHSAVDRGKRGTVSMTQDVSGGRQPSTLRECYAKYTSGYTEAGKVRAATHRCNKRSTLIVPTRDGEDWKVDAKDWVLTAISSCA